LFYFFIYFYRKKVYYTEDFKELSSAEGATYYSTYEEMKKALLETYYFDGTKNNYDQFSNFKKILNGKSESWYKMEIKRIVLLKGK
jgi:protein TonB